MNDSGNIGTGGARSGFTLVELMITVALTSILMLAISGVFVQNLRIWRFEAAIAEVNDILRRAEMQTTNELVGAPLDASDYSTTGAPNVQFTINLALDAVDFVKPLSIDGTLWSNPIRIQLRNEDTNGNLILDGGEDTDGNGQLDRVLERLEDGVNGTAPDGDFTDPGETVVLARNLEAVVFTLIGRQLTVTLTASKFLEEKGTDDIIVRDALAFTILLVN